MFYAKSTGGFYDSAIHGENMPADAVEISDAHHRALLDGQANGKIISADSAGRPVLSNKPAPTQQEIAAAVQVARGAAYSAESDPVFFKAQRGEATMDEWLAKVAEIKARIPDGVMPA